MKISNERGAANDKFNTSKAKIQYKRSNQPSSGGTILLH